MEQYSGEKKVFICKGCGGEASFDIESQAFRCPNCGREEALDTDSEIKEYDFRGDIPKPDEQWSDATHVVVCDSCGAQMVVEAAHTTANCTYCGSSHVLETRQMAGVRPEALVPFQIDEHAARNAVRKWLGKKLFAPRALKNLYQRDRLTAVYAPYWTFDADAAATYTAQGGRVYYVTVGSGENRRQVRRVRWTPVRGSLSRFFDDILVSARKERDPLAPPPQGFATKACVPFSLAYLSGFHAEKYTISAQEAFPEAKNAMESVLRDMARREVLSRYDQISGLNLNAKLFNVKFKHILLPLWMSGFMYGGKSYRVVINGQTGAVKGTYPKSRVRVGVAVALCIALAAVLIWYVLSEGDAPAALYW